MSKGIMPMIMSPKSVTFFMLADSLAGFHETNRPIVNSFMENPSGKEWRIESSLQPARNRGSPSSDSPSVTEDCQQSPELGAGSPPIQPSHETSALVSVFIVAL